MTAKEKKALRTKIEQEIDRLEFEAKRLEELTNPESLEGLDEISRMDAIVSNSVHDAARNAAVQRVAALKYAFKRLAEDEEFGYCSECGEAIPFKRLLAMPETTRCVSCAS